MLPIHVRIRKLRFGFMINFIREKRTIELVWNSKNSGWCMRSVYRRDHLGMHGVSQNSFSNVALLLATLQHHNQRSHLIVSGKRLQLNLIMFSWSGPQSWNSGWRTVVMVKALRHQRRLPRNDDTGTWSPVKREPANIWFYRNVFRFSGSLFQKESPPP